MDKIPYFRLKYSLIRKLMFQLAQIMGMVQLWQFCAGTKYGRPEHNRTNHNIFYLNVFEQT